ncbi:MAG: sigma-70 family RNA polymerase sigma factor [Bacillota bacterium]
MNPTNPDNLSLWKAYKQNNDQQAREQLILEYLELVKYQADRIKMRVPDFIDREDLEGFGIIGLIDALEKFDYRRGVKFTSYASFRIRGEIIDHLRRLDWLPHSLRTRGKQLKQKVEEMHQQLGYRPGPEQLASELEMPREDIEELYRKLYQADWMSLNTELGEEQQLQDLLENRDSPSPETTYDREQKLELLTEAINKLSDSQQLVISLYYYEELTQQEIAEIMELSPARISQIHTKAVRRLRGFLSLKRELLIG